jgi:DNA-3-methyladenine glycosylase II
MGLSDLIREGINYLAKVDPVMKEIIENNEAPILSPKSHLFATLCESIISQQLSVKAAAAIQNKINNYFQKGLDPKAIFETPDDVLKTLGLSRSKVSYLKDLSQKCISGELAIEQLPSLKDEEIIEQLVKVKGIGVWTAQMFLIFGLARLDVFPTGDLGIKKSIGQLYGFSELPKEDEMRPIGEKWRPYRSIASLYLWKNLNNTPSVKGEISQM